MTDYFALLEQPRRPWLDPEELKQTFHAKSLRAHPDVQPQNGNVHATAPEFTQLNEGYQVLSDPKRRLQHLLALEGAAPDARSNTVPHDVEELFPAVAAVTQQAQSLVEKTANATSPLSRSLLKPQLLQVQKEIQDMLTMLESRHAEAVGRLQHLDSVWEDVRSTSLAELHELYLRFSYLGRWTVELQEKQMQLSVL